MAAIWNAEWTRHNRLGHIAPELLVYIERTTSFGFSRDWFVRIRFERFGREAFWYWPVLSSDVLTSGAGTGNQTYTFQGTWNDASNSIECIGGGGSGGSGNRSASNAGASGAGAGAYAKIANFTKPGATCTYAIGAGGAAITPVAGSTVNTNGNDGGVTYFNASSDPGGGTDNTKCSAAAGIKGVVSTAPANGGIGGATASSWGTTLFAGGRGGNLTTAISKEASGAGGAGGTTATGSQGVDSAAGAQAGTNGGAGGTLNGGAAGTGNITGTATAGGNGTGIDGIEGAGGGGGGEALGTNAITTAGAGGLYGGGSGGNWNGGSGGGGSVQANVLAGGNGIIVVTWTPAAATFVARQTFFQQFIAQ